MRKEDLLSYKVQLSPSAAVDERNALNILPLVFGCYGVFVNTFLVSMHADLADADEHCKRLSGQQVEG
jgi:hypothetical protein